MSVWPFMHTWVHIYWYGQRQTESDHRWPLIGLPISSLGDNDGHTAVPMYPALAQRPSSHLWPLLSGTDPPLSVQCSQDQHPRQCPFHHSGPQCSFHKLSQALGLNEYTAMGFGLCKHTRSLWLADWSSKHYALPCPAIIALLHSSLNLCRSLHIPTHVRKATGSESCV